MSNQVEISVPPFGESIQSATCAEIKEKEGAFVEKGQTILIFQSEKAASEIYAPAQGVIRYAAPLEVGKEYNVGYVLGYIDTSVKAPAKKESSEKKEDQSAKPVTPPLSSLSPAEKSEKTMIANAQESSKSGIVESFEEWLHQKAKNEKEPAESACNTPCQNEYEERPMTPLRRAIAKRLVEARQKSAMLTTFNEVDMTVVQEMRQKHRELFEKKYGVKLGMSSFFVKAVVKALLEIPDVNSWIEGDKIIHAKHCHIAIAVSTDKGLMVPVLRHCEKLSFAEIESGIATLAKKARDGKITLADLTGASFTITNGGIFGSLLSTPILNPPQSAILGMHSIQKRAVVVDDQIVIRPMMYLALSYDHRMIDGKEAVGFLVAVKKVLEDPSQLLLEI